MWDEESGTNPVFNVYSHQLYGGCSFKYRQLRLRYWGMRHRTGFFKWCTAIPGGGVRFDRGTVRRLALSQINGGNCVSLPLNKGYGWAGSIIWSIFLKLFADPAGAGYPKERAKSQAMSRQTLAVSQSFPTKILQIF